MQSAEDRLREIAEQIRRGEQTELTTVRMLLAWFGAQRRGWAVTLEIEKTLKNWEFGHVQIFVTLTLIQKSRLYRAKPKIKRPRKQPNLPNM